MDRAEEYRDTIQRILEFHHSIPYSHGEIESKLIIDRDRNNFVLMNAGWDGKRRVHGCVVHVEIIGDKIVLAFQAPEARQYTGYAVA